MAADRGSRFVKGSTYDSDIEDALDAPRRGLFRRGRRTGEEASESRSTIDEMTPNESQVRDAVATVDELARRMDELTGATAVRTMAVSDDPVRAEVELQRAVIARANDLAAAGTGIEPAASHVAPNTPTIPTSAQNVQTPVAAEAPVQQIDTPVQTDADIEARLDAALSAVTPAPNPPAVEPVAVPAPGPAPDAEAAAAPMSMPATIQAVAAPDTVTLAPITTTAPPEPTPSRQAPAPMTDDTAHGAMDPYVSDDEAASLLGIDLNRVVRTIQEEAISVRQRIEFEVRDAHVQATDIIDRAEDEAERIREHGQSQARVLLGEVEEIISEAQQTGEQILHRANEEASSLRNDATTVLQQAQSEARSIVESARREGEQVLAEQRRLATVRAQEAMREQDRLKDQIRRLEERRRQVLESLEPLISQLTQMMPAGIEQNVVQLERQRSSAARS